MSIKKIEETFECFGIALLIILVFMAAVLRFFGIDVSWSVDMAQLMFSWICFIGADLALRKDRHMGVDLLIDRFPHKVKNIILIFNNILMLIFLVVVVVYGSNLCIVNFQRKFNTLPISYSFVTASAPVGGVLMVISVLGRLKENIRCFLQKDYSNFEKVLKVEN